MEKLVIAGREFNSRLFLGTGKFNNNQLMAEAIKASETEMVTVAMKRIELEDKQDDLLAHIVQNPNIQLLPNTSGVRNAEEAVFAAQMAREAFGTNWLFADFEFLCYASVAEGMVVNVPGKGHAGKLNGIPGDIQC